MGSHLHRYTWDFFIAHASADKESAEELHDLLESEARVFLDSRSLLLGDTWDEKIKQAQQDSFVTIVLISSITEDAYYQREEIAAAIALAREDPNSHRIIPIYLDGDPLISGKVPYGLRLKHGLTISDKLDLPAAAKKLVSLKHHFSEPRTSSNSNAPDKVRRKATYPKNANADLTLSSRASVNQIKGILAIVVIGIIGTIWFSIMPQPQPGTWLYGLGIVTLSKILVVIGPFILVLANWAETSLGPSVFVTIAKDSDKASVKTWIDAILGKKLSITWLVRVSLLSFPIMLTTGWVGLQLHIFPENWQDYGRGIGWVGYVGAGITLGLISTAKSVFLIELSSARRSTAVTIVSMLVLDIAATTCFLLVGLSGLLWIWWHFLQGSGVSLGDVVILLLDGSIIRTNARIYLPIAVATYAPCLLLAVLLIVRMFGSWFSFLKKISDRFDPQIHPLTSPLVGVIVIGSMLITVIGGVAKMIDTLS